MKLLAHYSIKIHVLCVQYLELEDGTVRYDGRLWAIKLTTGIVIPMV